MPGRKTIGISLIFAGLGILVALAFSLLLKGRQPTAGLKVDTNPASLVFVDNVQVGSTPLSKTFPEGEVVVKLVPQSTSSAFSSYQTKIRLTNKVYSILRRNFRTPESLSDGESINFQPESGNIASLTVVTSEPESASVVIDGRPQGLTPVYLPEISPGDHQISLSAPGYETKTISAATPQGYKMMVTAKLASLPFPTPTVFLPFITPPATSSASPAKPYVKISSTPTGFLRVRSAPNANGTEVGQVKPGETYPLLEKQTGWYLIKIDLPATSSGLPAGRQGWISSQYATLYE